MTEQLVLTKTPISSIHEMIYFIQEELLGTVNTFLRITSSWMQYVTVLSALLFLCTEAIYSAFGRHRYR